MVYFPVRYVAETVQFTVSQQWAGKRVEGNDRGLYYRGLYDRGQ
jgi:hypothetical protein